MNATDAAPDALRDRLLLREVNDRVVALAPSHLVGEIRVLCECADADCVELLRIGRDRYDATRAHPTRFVVEPDHAARGGDEVVDHHGEYVVVAVASEAGGRSSPTG